MDKHALITTLHEKRVEIKYGLILFVIVGSLFLLAACHVFDGIEAQVNAGMEKAARHGEAGLFLIALGSNWTLIIQVPYNLPMFTLVLYAESVPKVLLLATATGLGGGCGEALSYGIARMVIERVDNLENSALFRWTRRQIGRRPVLIPFLVWFVSAVPMPDALILVPVAMVKYPWRKLIVPILIGKVMQNMYVALIFYFTTGWASGLVSKDINIDLTASIVAVFVIVIAYQIEKSRLAERAAHAADAIPPVESTNGSGLHLFDAASDQPIEML
jgi:membrane protein YqaA with SNARE-associated domain